MTIKPYEPPPGTFLPPKAAQIADLKAQRAVGRTRRQHWLRVQAEGGLEPAYRKQVERTLEVNAATDRLLKEEIAMLEAE